MTRPVANVTRVNVHIYTLLCDSVQIYTRNRFCHFIYPNMSLCFATKAPLHSNMDPFTFHSSDKWTSIKPSWRGKEASIRANFVQMSYFLSQYWRLVESLQKYIFIHFVRNTDFTEMNSASCQRKNLQIGYDSVRNRVPFFR